MSSITHTMSNATFASQLHMLLILLTENMHARSNKYLSCMRCCLHVLALTLCLVSAEPAARHAPARTCVPHPQSLLPAPDALWSLPPATRLLFEAHACTHRLRRCAAVSVNAYNYTSQSHCSNIGGPSRSRLCFSGARLAPTPRACDCVRVLRCVEARALGRRTCMPTSSRRSGLSLCPRVVSVPSCASRRPWRISPAAYF